MLLSENELIKQLILGNELAYRQLYMQHYELLCRVAYVFLSDKQLAESVVSQLIADIWEKRSRLLISTPLRAYLVRAVRNRCINFLKLEYNQRESRWSESELLLDGVLSDVYPAAQLLGRELENELFKAVEHLSPECRRVFELSRFDELTNVQIAEKLSISVNTVKYHIKNALAQLRTDLSEYLTIILFFFLLR